MSLALDRELLTQAAIVVGVCLGGWIVLVEPKVSAAHEIEGSNLQMRQLAAAVTTMPPEEIAEQTSRLHALCAQIESRSRLSADTAQLFSRITGLAAEHRVEIRNLQPRIERTVGGNAPSITKIDMTVDGEYPALAGFLGSLQGLPAYVRTWTVQIMPESGQEAKRASMQLGCEALGFALPAAVESLRRGQGAMSDHQRLVKSITVFALPVVLAKVAAVLLFGNGPTGATASVPVPASVALPRLDAPKTLTVVQQAAAAHIALLGTLPMGGSPLLHGRVAAPPIKPVEREAAPEALLQAILDAGSDSVAYFDGKRHKLGDALHASQWILVEINGYDRSVTVEHQETSERYTYYVPLGSR